MIGEKLAGIYASLEEKWYNLLEFLDSKGIPVGAYSNFLEGRGIPSFPVTIGIIVLLIAVLFVLFTATAGVNLSVNISIKDDAGNGVNEVHLAVTDSKQNLIKETTANSIFNLNLGNIPIGTDLTFSATKQGYDIGSADLTVTSASGDVEIILDKERNLIEAKIKLANIDTSDQITSAVVKLIGDNGTEYPGILQEDGTFIASGVPADEDLKLVINADGYETFEDIYSFKEGETKQITLAPKKISFAGKASLLINVLDKETSNPVKDVKIKILNSKTNAVISDVTETDGQFTGKVETGTSIKWIISKEGYLNEEGAATTIVNEETTFTVFLKKGGEELNVYLLNQMEFPIPGGIASLYNENAEFIDSNVTGMSGYVKFQGLDPNKSYYVTGYKDGFLPARKKISAADTKSTSLKLEPTSADNSATLLIKVLDLTEKPVNNADVEIYEMLDNQTLPLGYANRKTDLAGQATIIAPVSKTLLVKASKEFDEGQETVLIQKSVKNEVTVYLAPKADLIILNLKDEKGKAVEGHATILSIAGDILFDGNVKDGKITFDPEDNESGILQLTFNDGSTYEEQLDFKDQKGKEIEVKVYKDSGELTPKIEYLGIIDEKGNEVAGITKEKFYWLKFQLTSMPNLTEVGVHIRVGKDDIKFVDSQAVAIYGFDSTANKFTVGRTYSAKPEPGSEGIDRKNTGTNGKANKWLDLVFNQRADVEIIKVKVKAMQTLQEDEFEVHYRAWTNVKNEYYRTPHDDILDKAKSNEKRNPLYAKTFIQAVKVFDKEEFVCEQAFCVTYAFYDELENRFAEQEFSPTVNRPYAVEFTIYSNQEGTAKGILSTNAKQPSLAFNSWVDGGFVNMPAGSNKEYELSFDSLVSQKEGKKITAFFTPEKADSTYISLKLASGDKVIDKKLLLNITEEGILNIKTKPDAIALGKPFWIIVSDANTGKLMENLTVAISDDKGKTVNTIIGNGTKDKGSNGEYAAGSGLQAGLYKVEINHPKYKKAVKDILVSRDDLLYVQPEIKVDLPYAVMVKAEKLQVENKSIFNITNITYELKTDSEFDENLGVKMAPMAAIDAEKKGMFDLSVTYKGDKESRMHSEAELIIRGMVNGFFPVQATTKLIVTYNKELEEDCLEIEQKQVTFSLVGTAGTQGKEKVKLTNKCKEALNLKADIEGLKDSAQLDIGAPAFTLNAGEEKEIELTAINKIDRLYSQALQQTYKVYFKAAQLTRSIPLIVILRHPLYLLITNNNIVMWLNEKENKWEANAQLYMRNVGEKPIKYIRFATLNKPQAVFVDVSNYVQNYMANPNPWETGDQAQTYYNSMNQMYNTGMPAGSNYGYLNPQYTQNMTLLPGQELSPPATITAKASSIKDLKKGPLNAKVMILGNIEGRDYPLKVVDIWLYFTGTECLRVTEKEALNFESEESKEGVMTKELEIYNACAEEVTALTPETTNLGANKLSLSLPSKIIMAGQKVSAQLVLEKGGDYSTGESPLQTKIKGLLARSQQFTYSAPLNITVVLGKKFAAKGKSTLAENLPICNKEGKTMAVKYPLINEKDCAEGYCDAKAMSAFLLKRADSKVNLVKKRIKDGQNDARNFNCAKTDFCTFTELGISSSFFNVFLQNDAVTEDLLQAVMEKESYLNLKGFVMRTRDITAEDLSSAFETRTVLVSSNMMGCGKYKVTITGGAQRIGNKLTEDDLAVIIRVEKDAVTDECLPRVYNTLNFLPKDLGLDPENSYNTWLGTVSLTEQGLAQENKQDMKNIALEFSRNLFNSEKRFGEFNSNKVRVTLGNTEGTLMKIAIDPGYSPDSADKREIVVTVNKDYLNVADPEKKKQILAEIAAAIKTIVSQKFTGCISEQGDYLLVKNLPKGIESLVIRPKEQKLGLLFKQESCVDFNVVGIIKDTELELHSNWGSLDNKSGLKEAYFKDNKGKKLREYTDVGSGDVIKLSDKGEKGEFYHIIKFCVLSTDEKVNLATGTQITIKARSTTIAKMESNEAIIKIEDCGIDPVTLMKRLREEYKKMGKGQKKEFYIPQVAWNCNSADSVPISKLATYVSMETDASGTPLPPVLAAGATIPNVPYMQQKEQEKFNTSLAKYTMHCAWASGLCNAAIGWWRGGPIFGAITGVLGDCIAPAAITYYGHDNATVRDSAEKIVDLFKPIPDPSQALGGPGISPESQLQLMTAGSMTEDQYRTLLGSSIAGAATATLVQEIYRYNSFLSTKNYSNVADNIFKKAQKSFNKELFDGKAPKSVLAEFEKIYRQKIKDAVKTAANSWYSKPARLTQESIAQIINGATGGIDKTAFDVMSTEIVNASKVAGKFDLAALKTLSPKLGIAVEDLLKGIHAPADVVGNIVTNAMEKPTLESIAKGATQKTLANPGRLKDIQDALVAGDNARAATLYDDFLREAAESEADLLAEKMLQQLESRAGAKIVGVERANLVAAFKAEATPLLIAEGKVAAADTADKALKDLLSAVLKVKEGVKIDIKKLKIDSLVIDTTSAAGSKVTAKFPRTAMEAAITKGGAGMATLFDDAMLARLGDLMVEVTDAEGKVVKMKLSELGDASKRAEDAVKKALTEGGEASKAITGTEGKWWKKIKPKNFLKMLAKPGFWLDMGLGLGCGLASNLAGYYLGFKPTYQDMTQEQYQGMPVVHTNQSPAVDIDGDGKIDPKTDIGASCSDPDIRKGTSVVATVAIDQKGQPHICLKRADKKPDTVSEIIAGDCTGAYKDVKPYFGGLNVPSTDPAFDPYKQHEAELILSVSNAKKYNATTEMNEALLSSVAIAASGFGTFKGTVATAPNVDTDADGKVDYIAGCGASSLPFRKVEKNNAQLDFDCAAYELTRLSVLKTGNIDDAALTEYYNGMLPAYKHSLIPDATAFVSAVKSNYNRMKAYQIK